MQNKNISFLNTFFDNETKDKKLGKRHRDIQESDIKDFEIIQPANEFLS